MLDNWNAEWVNTIESINKLDWTTIFGSSVIKSYDFFYAMEKAQSKEIIYHYLKVSNGESVEAIIPCFFYKLDLLNLLTGKTLKNITKPIRNVMPRFLKINTFVIGSYAATVEEFVGINRKLSDIDFREVCNIIYEQIKAKSKEVGSSIVFIKDIRESNVEFLREALPQYRFYSSFPTNIIPVSKICQPYPMVLKKKHRKRYRKYQELFDREFSWEIIQDFEEYTEIFTELYSNVLNGAKNKFETLNMDFFTNINKYIPEKSFLLVARDHSKLIRVMELIIVEEDRLLPIYLGIRYMEDDTKVLYLNVIFKTIQLAESMGKEIIDLGQTSYYPKVMSGAFVENLYYGFYSPKVIVNYLIKNVFASIFEPILVPDHVYLEDKKDEIIAFLEAKGFCLMNK